MECATEGSWTEFPESMSLSPRLRHLTTTAVLLLTAALAVLGAHGFQRKLESFQPLGFVARPGGDHWEVERVDPAARTGLAAGDRIVLVDGAEAGRTPVLSRALRAGPSAELVVLRGEQLVTLTYQRPPLDVDFPYLILALVGCGYLAIGLYTLWRSQSGLLFYLWCLSSAVLYVFSPLFPPADGLARATYFLDEAARLLLPPLTLHLFVSISRGGPREGRRWIPFLYLPAAALLLLQADLVWANGRLLAGRPTAALLALLDRLELGLLFAFAALAVVVLARRLAGLHDWERRRQLLWLLVGMAGGYLPFFLFYGLPALVGLRLPETFSTLAVVPLAAVPFAFAWAVLRYRLWDLGVMVRNGLSYGLTLLFGLTTFSLIDLAVRRALPESYSFTRDLVTFFGGLLVVGLIVPTHRGIQGVLERVQYGGALGRRRGLQRLGQELLQERDLDRLCTALITEIQHGLEIDRANLLLLQGPALVPVRPQPGLPRSVALAALREGLWEGDFELLSPIALPGEPATAEQQAYGAGYRYAFALRVRGHRIGLALTTLRHDRQPLSSEDVDLVRALLDQAALAIENAQLLDQVQRQLDQVTSLQRHNQGILESSPAGIALLDAEGRVASANLAFAALAGRARAELLGQELLALLPLGELPEPGAALRQIAIAEPGGAERHLQVSVAPMQDGAPDQRVVVLQDVSERMAMEKALREQDRLASLGVLAAGVAHEVNTPLTGISSYAQMLLADTPAGDPRRELLEKVERQTFRASRIVNSLLDFARKRDHERGPVDLAALVGETVDLLRERLSSRSIRLAWSPPDERFEVSGSEGELQQVLTNLVLNALDAVAPAGGEIRVGLAGDAETAAIVVEDNGTGILPEHLNRVFQPFFTTKTGKGGTGLGLAICQSIVEQHGGRIRVENLEAGGCRFTVELPRSIGTPRTRETR